MVEPMNSGDTGDDGHDYTADAARLLALLEARVARKNFLHGQVTRPGEQGEEEPTQPGLDAVRRSGRSVDGMR